MALTMGKRERDRAEAGEAGFVERREVLRASAAVLGSALAPVALARAGDDVVTGAAPGRPTSAAGALAGPAPRIASDSPFPPLFEKTAWDRRGLWDASWVGCADAGEPPLVTAYRLRFDWPAAGSVRLRVSADERYELFLDGRRIGRGPERGTVEHWFYDSHDVPLAAGAHVLVARVFSLGPHAPLAQFQVRPAFLLAAEGPEAKPPRHGRRGLGGEAPAGILGRAAGLRLGPLRAGDASTATCFAWGFERGEGEGWRPVVVHERAASALVAYGIAPSRYLRAGTLPPMIDRPWARGARASRGRGALARYAEGPRPCRRPPRERDGGLAGPAPRPRADRRAGAHAAPRDRRPRGLRLRLPRARHLGREGERRPPAVRRGAARGARQVEVREGQPRRDRGQVLPRHGRQLPPRRRRACGASRGCGSRAGATWRSPSRRRASR